VRERKRRRETGLLSGGNILQFQSVSGFDVADQLIEGLHLGSQREAQIGREGGIWLHILASLIID
jgi:hypothetical protein